MSEKAKIIIQRADVPNENGTVFPKETLQAFADERPDTFYIDEAGNLCLKPGSIERFENGE